MDVERGFEPKYVTIKGKTKTLSELKKAAKGASAIYLATDPDREGEAIAWHVADQINSQVPTHRVLSRRSPRTPCSPRCGEPGEIDERKVDAQQARRILDRLVGYKASPILWRTIKTGLSAGRVQTVALRLIVEREREIRAFKPQEYWTIEALCAKERPDLRGLARQGGRTQAPAPQRGRCPGGGGRGARRCRSSSPRWRSAAGRSSPAAPFTTSTLQQEAAKKLGFSSRRTMRAAQDLYEGMDVGEEGPVGLITYMRTDSVRVSDTAVAVGARAHRRAATARRTCPAQPNAYSDRKNARVQGAHEAIRPTDVRRRPEQVQSYLEPDQFRLYQLIWQRFVASQMTPAVYDMTVVEFDLGQYLFRATGSVMVFDGYHVLYTEGREKEEGREVEDLSPIPPLAAGRPGGGAGDHAVAALHRAAAALLRGQPGQGAGAARHRPAVHLQRHHLDARRRGSTSGWSSGASSPPSWARLVEKIMVGKFPEIFNVEFTSGMENELDRIEEGELGWQRVLAGLLRALHQGARRGGHERARRRRARARARGAGQGALPQVRLADRAQDRALRALPRLHQVQGHLRLREVAQEGKRARPAHRREVPPLRLADGDQDRPLRRVPRLHHLPGVQGHPGDPDRA